MKASDIIRQAQKSVDDDSDLAWLQTPEAIAHMKKLRPLIDRLPPFWEPRNIFDTYWKDFYGDDLPNS